MGLAFFRFICVNLRPSAVEVPIFGSRLFVSELRVHSRLSLLRLLAIGYSRSAGLQHIVIKCIELHIL
jgi:hypothetical protein